MGRSALGKGAAKTLKNWMPAASKFGKAMDNSTAKATARSVRRKAAKLDSSRAVPARKLTQAEKHGFKKARQGLDDGMKQVSKDLKAGGKQARKWKGNKVIVGGYNKRTGKFDFGTSGKGPDGRQMCAEDDVVKKLGGNKDDVVFTKAYRTRNADQPGYGETVPVCSSNRCQGTYNPRNFEPGTRYDRGGPWDPKVDPPVRQEPKF